MRTPTGEKCLNCGWEFPCTPHRWGRRVLVDAGWSEAEIDALDVRTGPWSAA